MNTLCCEGTGIWIVGIVCVVLGYWAGAIANTPGGG